MIYSIEFDKTAFKYLKKLDKSTRIRIIHSLQILSEDPFNSELDIKRMKGTIDEFRLRIGSYRIVYSLENNKLLIYVIKIGSRGDIYKKKLKSILPPDRFFRFFYYFLGVHQLLLTFVCYRTLTDLKPEGLAATRLVLAGLSAGHASDMFYQLSDRDLHLVSDLIYRLIDESINLDAHIPFDDEPLSEDDLHAITEAEQEFREGCTIKFEDVKNELLQD